MAKSDSFFIRAEIESNGTTYAQNEIDLGSFVNLGVSKSTLLRIHNVSVQYTDANGVVSPIGHAAGDYKIAFQLATQSQTALVTANDKSIISTGSIVGHTDVYHTQDFDVAPQHWRNGYLVGVDSLFLGVDSSVALDTGNFIASIVMECTLENATQSNALALSLSQA